MMLQKEDLKQVSDFMRLLLSSESVKINTTPARSGQFALSGTHVMEFEDIRRLYPLVDLYIQPRQDTIDLYWRALRQVGAQLHVKVFATYRHAQNKLLIHPPLANLQADLHIEQPFTLSSPNTGQIEVDNCLSAAQIAQLHEKLNYQNAYRSEHSGSYFSLLSAPE